MPDQYDQFAEEPQEPIGMLESALVGLSEVIDGIAAQTCARHYPETTEEPELTAILADKIETQLQKFQFVGLDIKVQVQTFPSHSPGALEKVVGADLYISTIVRAERSVVSKGLLVQAKWDGRAGTDRRLSEQVAKMIERSAEGSYVWLYEPVGIEVIPARDVFQIPRRPGPDGQRTPGQLIASSIRCNAGDQGIGRIVEGARTEPLRSVMERIGARNGLGFIVTPRSG